MGVTEGFGREGAGVRALYVHLPFCARKCAYCDFPSWETERESALIAQYVARVKDQLAAFADAGLLELCETAYLGGGTPTFLGSSLLGGLVRSVRSAAPGVRELSCEANPDSLTDEVLAALVDAGATRLSIGVQSLDDGELEALGRLHDAERARERVAAAVASGLDVSADLMCATPLQTDESWAATLSQAVGLGVWHVSVYPLQIEEGTPLGRSVGDSDPAWNDPEVQARRMEYAARVLTDAGYSRYEVASYAKPGKDCLHNQAYWTGKSYLGVGTGASSMLDAATYARLRRLMPQLPSVGEGVSRVRLTCTTGRADFAHVNVGGLSLDLEFLTESQAVAEDLMLGLRMTRGVGAELVERGRELLGRSKVDAVVDSVVIRSLATWEGGRLVPTTQGWLLGNELYGAFWELAPGEVEAASC